VQPVSDLVRYEPAFGANVRVTEYARPMLSDEIETAQTIHTMDQHAEADAAHRLVINATLRALSEAGIGLDASALEKAIAVYWFLKRTIRYVPTPATSPLVDQTLIPPVSLLSMPDPEGDCPQFSMLAAAMLRVCCVPSFFVTIAADPEMEQYSHVYNTVRVAPGRFLPFDSSNGPAPGAEYAQWSKKKVWPTRHRFGCDVTAARAGFGDARSHIPEVTPMMHNAGARTGRNQVLRRRLNGPRDYASYSAHGHIFRALQGLGQLECDEDGNCYDSSTGTYTPAPVNVSLSDLQSSAVQGDCAYGMDASGNCLPGTTPLATVAAGSGAGVPSAPSGALPLVASIVNTAAAAAAPAIAAASRQAPYYITNPATGQSVLYNPNTGTTASGIFSGSSGSSGIFLLLIAGLGIFALSKG